MSLTNVLCMHILRKHRPCHLNLLLVQVFFASFDVCWGGFCRRLPSGVEFASLDGFKSLSSEDNIEILGLHCIHSLNPKRKHMLAYYTTFHSFERPFKKTFCYK